MTGTGFALRTDGLGKRYRKGWALHDCTLVLPLGGVIALVGPNGAGKTTLLRLAVGLLAPSSGTVEVLGSDVTAGTPHTLSRVGFLARDHPLYQRFTVAEMLRFGRACTLRFDQGPAERRLATLGIPLGRRTGALSGGQQAQVALALALAKRPDMLVLDEPVASLDPPAPARVPPDPHGRGRRRRRDRPVLLPPRARAGARRRPPGRARPRPGHPRRHPAVGVYHPADRFWAFQLVEAALFVAVAAVLFAVVVWRVRRRVL